MSGAQDRKFSARLDCHYLLLAPEEVDSQTPLVLTLHGFGANPETMLQLTALLFDRQPVIAALQGPNQFFLGADTREVGYGWITSRRPVGPSACITKWCCTRRTKPAANSQSHGRGGCWSDSSNWLGSIIDLRRPTRMRSAGLSTSAAACQETGRPEILRHDIRGALV